VPPLESLRSLAPVLITLLAPLILLFTPLLLPLGMVLMVFGLGRAGLIATLGGDVPVARRLTSRERELRDLVDDAAISPTRTGRHASGKAHHRVATEAPQIEMRDGSLTELTQLGGKHAEHLVKQARRARRAHTHTLVLPTARPPPLPATRARHVARREGHGRPRCARARR